MKGKRRSLTAQGHFLDVTGIVRSHTRAAYWQRHGRVKYSWKLERSDNEARFNNAFDLNRNVMKIITSDATGNRDAPINDQPGPVHRYRSSLYFTRFPGHFSISLSRQFPLISSALSVAFLLQLARPDDEFIGGSRAEWPCILTVFCSKGKHGK